MLEYKLQQEQMARERQEQKVIALNRARDLVQEKRAEAAVGAAKAEQHREQRIRDAAAIRQETKRNTKMIEKQEKQYLRKAQEKRFELQVMNEASRIRQEQFLVSKMESQKRQKEEALWNESRLVVKRDREARKLELLEAEVMKRLKDTHLR
jgi:hypothetical protein